MQRAILTGKIDLDEEEPEDRGITIADAIETFYAEQRGRGAATATASIKSFRKFLDGAPNRKNLDLSKFSPTILEFADREGIVYLTECSTPFLDRFRQSWKVNKFTNDKQTQRLKTFFEFAVSRKRIKENPAKPLEPVCWKRQ